MVSRLSFYENLADIFDKQVPIVVFIFFMSEDAFHYSGYTLEERERLIHEAWRVFFDSISIPMKCTRLGWQKYFGFIRSENMKEIENEFKSIFMANSQADFAKYWRIAFMSNKQFYGNSKSLSFDDFVFGIEHPIKTFDRDNPSRIDRIYVVDIAGQGEYFYDIKVVSIENC